MDNDVIIDESRLPEVVHLGFKGKIKVRLDMIKSKWRSLPPETKKKRIIFAVVTVLIVVALAGGLIILSGNGESETDVQGDKVLSNNLGDITVVEPEEPADQVSPLTGQLITKSAMGDLQKRRVLAVVVENHPDARPQSGLDKADVVFETLVEGGITRFVPIYLSQQPEVIGPVRSMRKYFLDFAAGFGDPVMMHIGYAESSNPEANAIGEIRRTGVNTLGFTSAAYWRVSDRSAPHNAYASAVKLWELAGKEGWTGFVPNGLWLFKDAQEKVSNPSVEEMVVNWINASTTWSTKWKYDSTTNMYLRYHQNEPHIDAISNKQLATRNVIIMYTDQASANDGTARIVVDAIGSGSARFFMDGEMVEGTWEKPERTSQYVFKNLEGDEIVFNRGQSWIMVVPKTAEVIY